MKPMTRAEAKHELYKLDGGRYTTVGMALEFAQRLIDQMPESADLRVNGRGEEDQNGGYLIPNPDGRADTSGYRVVEIWAIESPNGNLSFFSPTEDGTWAQAIFVFRRAFLEDNGCRAVRVKVLVPVEKD